MWWTQIIIMIASYVISGMLMRPPKQKPAALEDIEFPQFEEGSPQEVFFGDVWTESWMVLGTGDFRKKEIKKSNGLGGSTVVGFKYYMGILMGLGRGPLDEIVEIEIGDRQAWTGSVTANSTIAIDKPGLFGGKKREGGIVGTVKFLFGDPTQVPDPSISSLVGTPVPGLRGFTSVWYDGYFAANSAYPKVWKFRCRRALKGWYQDACWYPAKAVIPLEAGTVKAMNPAHIVYECLTNPQWGRGFAAAKLDAASFTSAADRFYAENFGLCLRWTRQDKIRAFVQSVLDHAGAALYHDRVTGLIKLVPIRGDYDVESLPLFNYDNGLLEVLDDDNGAQSVGVNEVIVQYRRAADNESRQVRVQNVGAMTGNGKIAQRVDYPGLPTHELAALAAQRDLRAGSGFLKRFRLRMDRRAYDAVPPAGLFRFTAPDRGIAQMVVRVGACEEGERDGWITATVLQDHFSLDTTYFVSEEPNTFVVPAIVELPEGNEATSITVISATLTAPPGSPADGDQYLVASGATGAWVGKAGYLAAWNTDEAVWDFVLPSAGTLIHVQASGAYVAANGAGGTAAAPWTPPPPAVLHVQDRKPSGTAGGTSTSATWHTRALNTVIGNTIAGASLATNQITLPAGTYEIVASAPCHQGDGHQIALYNVTDAAYALIGQSGFSRSAAGTDGTSRSTTTGIVALAATKVFELRHYVTTGLATSGLGAAVASGQVQVYADVFIKRIA